MDDQERPALDPADGGVWSRKLWYAIGTSAAVMLGGVGYALLPAFRTGYETYIGGLLGVLGLYLGGNVTNKLVVAKHLAMQVAAKAARAEDDQGK